MSVSLKGLLACTSAADGPESFVSAYSRITKYFAESSSYHPLQAAACDLLEWPKEPGVYVVIEKLNNTFIYVGMTGLFNTDGRCSRSQGLHHRPGRWTPYCFARDGAFANHFCYGPKYSTGEDKRLPPRSGYRCCIPIDQLRVDCFVFDREGRFAPSMLEALFLQLHLSAFGFLPPANNKF